MKECYCSLFIPTARKLINYHDDAGEFSTTTNSFVCIMFLSIRLVSRYSKIKGSKKFKDIYELQNFDSL